MSTPYLLPDLKRFEGCRLTAYQDTRGVWTIGWGHTPAEPGQTCSQATADTWLSLDVGIAVRGLDADPATEGWWRELDPVRADALIEMAFNMGERTLDVFKHMLAALKAKDWAGAAAAALDSAWCEEVNGDGRADWIAHMLRTGARPTPPTP
jgi:lysozyme